MWKHVIKMSKHTEQLYGSYSTIFPRIFVIYVYIYNDDDDDETNDKSITWVIGTLNSLSFGVVEHIHSSLKLLTYFTLIMYLNRDFC